MPRLVLYDDHGRQLFSGEVAQKNVDLVAHFLKRHMGTFKAVASLKRSVDELLDAANRIGDGVARIAPPPPRRRR